MLDNLPKGTDNLTSRETEVLVSSATNMVNIAKAWANMVNEVRKNGPMQGANGDARQNSVRSTDISEGSLLSDPTYRKYRLYTDGEKISVGDVKDIYFGMRTNTDMDPIADRVFELCDKYGIRFTARDVELLHTVKGTDAVGTHALGRIQLATGRYASDENSPVDGKWAAKRKSEAASTILHEAIHGVTTYAFDIYERLQSKGYIGETEQSNKDAFISYNEITNDQGLLNELAKIGIGYDELISVKEFVEEMNSIFGSLKNATVEEKNGREITFAQKYMHNLSVGGKVNALKGMPIDYGMTNTKEFVAELANPVFCEHLKKASLFDRVVDAICKFFGIKSGNVYDVAKNALGKFLLDDHTASARKMYHLTDTNFDLKNSDRRFSVRMASDGTKFVEIDSDAINLNNGRSIAQNIAVLLANKYHNVLKANGQYFRANADTNREWRESNWARKLRKKLPDGYYDKIKSIANADELISAARNWICEQPLTPHESVTEFARAKIDFRVNNNGYEADIIIAIKKDGTALLYDLTHIAPKTILDAPLSSSGNALTSRLGTSNDLLLSQQAVDVNTKNTHPVRAYEKEDATPAGRAAESVKNDAKRIGIETNKPVQASIRQRGSIRSRTMAMVQTLVESGKISEEQAKQFETVGNKVDELCRLIEKDYFGKMDKNGMPLLPEDAKDVKLSNNIFSNSSYSKDA